MMPLIFAILGFGVAVGVGYLIIKVASAAMKRSLADQTKKDAKTFLNRRNLE